MIIWGLVVCSVRADKLSTDRPGRSAGFETWRNL